MSAVVTSVAVGAAVVLSQFNPRSSIQSLFTVSEYFQLLWSLLLLKIQLPEKVYNLLQSFLIFKLDLGMFQQYLPLNNDSIDSLVKMEKSQERFSKIDINYKSTLFNYSVLILLVMIIGIAHSLVTLFYSRYKILNKIQGTEKARWSKLLLKIHRFFNYNFYVSLFAQSFLFFMIIAFEEIFTFTYSNFASALSLFCTIVLVVSSWIWVVVLWWYILKTKVKDIPGPMEELYAGQRMDTLSGRLYTVFFLIRRFGIITAIFISNKFIQYSLFLGVNGFHLVMFVMKWPFRDVVDSLIQLLTDMSIMVLIFVYSLVNEVNDTDEYNEDIFERRGDLIWIIIIVSNSLITIIALVLSAFKLTKILKKCWKNKDTVEVWIYIFMYASLPFNTII